MLTIDEAITLVNIEKECINRADNCNRKCNECDLVQDSNKLLDLYEQLAEWLEELKAYREIGTIEECKNSVLDIAKAYNKAINDSANRFISLCDDGEFMNRLNEFPATTILEMAKQLKVGGGCKNPDVLKVELTEEDLLKFKEMIKNMPIGIISTSELDSSVEFIDEQAVRNKAIDDFFKSIRGDIFNYYSNEAYIKYDDLCKIAEQFKAGGKNG